MSLLKYLCPETSKEVTTGIDTDPKKFARMGTLKIAVACTHCPDGHIVTADSMFFIGPDPTFEAM
jgi:hypothetical protein